MALKDKTSGATKVALVSCSGILGDLIRRAVNRDEGIAVVEDLAAADSVAQLSALRRAHPDAVVWLLADDSAIAAHTELFGADPGWAVIAVIDDGRRSNLWELRPHRTVLGAPSIDGLIDTLRDVAVRP